MEYTLESVSYVASEGAEISVNDLVSTVGGDGKQITVWVAPLTLEIKGSVSGGDKLPS